MKNVIVFDYGIIDETEEKVSYEKLDVQPKSQNPHIFWSTVFYQDKEYVASPIMVDVLGKKYLRLVNPKILND